MVRTIFIVLAMALNLAACKTTREAEKQTRLQSTPDSSAFIEISKVKFKLRQLKDKINVLDPNEEKYTIVDKVLYVKNVSGEKGAAPTFISPSILVGGQYLAFGVDRYRSAEKILTAICKSYDPAFPYFNEVDYEGKGKTKPDLFGNWTFNKNQLIVADGGESKRPLIITVDEPYVDGQKTAAKRQAVLSFSCGNVELPNFQVEPEKGSYAD